MISVAGIKLHRISRPEISDETRLKHTIVLKAKKPDYPADATSALAPDLLSRGRGQNITTSNIRSFAKI